LKSKRKIKKCLVSSTSFLVLAFWPIYSSAEERSLSYSILKFSAGIVAGALIHEGSHALVAGLTDTEMSWNVGTYNQPIGFTENAKSKDKGVAVYSTGLLSQAIGGEIILQSDKIDKNDSFTRGMMAWNILNSIFYSLDYWFFRVTNKENGKNYQGDLKGIEHYSNESVAQGFAFSMAAIATYQGYRFLKTQTWAPDWLKSDFQNLHLDPLPSGGFLISYKFTF